MAKKELLKKNGGGVETRRQKGTESDYVIPGINRLTAHLSSNKVEIKKFDELNSKIPKDLTNDNVENILTKYKEIYEISKNVNYKSEVLNQVKEQFDKKALKDFLKRNASNKVKEFLEGTIKVDELLINTVLDDSTSHKNTDEQVKDLLQDKDKKKVLKELLNNLNKLSTPESTQESTETSTTPSLEPSLSVTTSTETSTERERRLTTSPQSSTSGTSSVTTANTEDIKRLALPILKEELEKKRKISNLANVVLDENPNYKGISKKRNKIENEIKKLEGEIKKLEEELGDTATSRPSKRQRNQGGAKNKLKSKQKSKQSSKSKKNKEESLIEKFKNLFKF